MTGAPPPAAVVRAFSGGADDGPPSPLAGGAGTSWRVGRLVLKPLDTSAADLAWRERLLAPLQGRDDVRVSPPLRGAGELVVGGWTATRWLEGRSAAGRWSEVAEAGRRLHAAVAGAPRPEHLAARRDPWAVGDRVAWGGADAVLDLLPAELRALAGLRRPVHLPSQVVHGDLSGNVLVHPGLAPAVIDLAAYWRPAPWGAAVVVADALVWHGADAALVDLLLPGPDGAQLLVRAVLFRAVTAALAGARGGPAGEWARAARAAASAAGR